MCRCLGTRQCFRSGGLRPQQYVFRFRRLAVSIQRDFTFAISIDCVGSSHRQCSGSSSYRQCDLAFSGSSQSVFAFSGSDGWVFAFTVPDQCDFAVAFSIQRIFGFAVSVHCIFAFAHSIQCVFVLRFSIRRSRPL